MGPRHYQVSPTSLLAEMQNTREQQCRLKACQIHEESSHLKPRRPFPDKASPHCRPLSICSALQHDSMVGIHKIMTNELPLGVSNTIQTSTASWLLVQSLSHEMMLPWLMCAFAEHNSTKCFFFERPMLHPAGNTFWLWTLSTNATKARNVWRIYMRDTEFWFLRGS